MREVSSLIPDYCNSCFLHVHSMYLFLDFEKNFSSEMVTRHMARVKGYGLMSPLADYPRTDSPCLEGFFIE